MADAFVPCDSCGKGIPDIHFASGSAITVLGKNFCSECKKAAIEGISLDDLVTRPGAEARPPVRAVEGRAGPTPPKAGTTPPKAGSISKPAGAAGPAAKVASSPGPPPSSPSGPKAGGVEFVRIELPAAAPAPLPPSPDAPTVREAPRAPRPAPPGRTPPPRRRVPLRRPGSRTPLFLAGGIAGVGAILALAILLTRGSDKTRAPLPPVEAGGTSGSSSSPKTPPTEDRETRAQKAYAGVEEFWHTPGNIPDDVLAAVERARPACQGTPWEKKLEELRKKVLQERETAEVQKELTKRLEELRAAAAADPDFKRYAELRPKFQEAAELAARAGPSRIAEIRQLQQEYTGRYEKVAQPYYDEINEAANQLSEERRFDEAIAKIDTFPRSLRLSNYWASLEKLRQDIERRKRAAPPKK